MKRIHLTTSKIALLTILQRFASYWFIYCVDNGLIKNILLPDGIPVNPARKGKTYGVFSRKFSPLPNFC